MGVIERSFFLDFICIYTKTSHAGGGSEHSREDQRKDHIMIDEEEVRVMLRKQ